MSPQRPAAGGESRGRDSLLYERKVLQKDRKAEHWLGDITKYDEKTLYIILIFDTIMVFIYNYPTGNNFHNIKYRGDMIGWKAGRDSCPDTSMEKTVHKNVEFMEVV